MWKNSNCITHYQIPFWSRQHCGRDSCDIVDVFLSVFEDLLNCSAWSETSFSSAGPSAAALKLLWVILNMIRKVVYFWSSFVLSFFGAWPHWLDPGTGKVFAFPDFWVCPIYSFRWVRWRVCVHMWKVGQISRCERSDHSDSGWTEISPCT